jgi:hypothetical protein
MRITSNLREAMLLEAVLEIACDECLHGEWDEIEPLLAEAWEELRGDGTVPWTGVAERVRAWCETKGRLH